MIAFANNAWLGKQPNPEPVGRLPRITDPVLVDQVERILSLLDRLPSDANLGSPTDPSDFCSVGGDATYNNGTVGCPENINIADTLALMRNL